MKTSKQIQLNDIYDMKSSTSIRKMFEGIASDVENIKAFEGIACGESLPSLDQVVRVVPARKRTDRNY